MFGLFGYPVMTSFKRDLWDGTADYLILAGGGGGGGTLDGGGGAGGYRTSWGTGTDGTGGNSGGLSILETALTLNRGTAYSITVGQGGEGGLGWGNTINVAGHQGRTTSISGADITTVTTTGGGRGSGHAQGALDDGGPGGSGGGGAANVTNSPGGAGVSGEGSNGGNGATTNTAGGGGGGAGAAGQQGTATVAGDGGDGLASTITGVSITRAGGGGGGTRQANATTRSNGGAGGGGDGGWQTVASVDWNTSTGSAAEHGRSGYGGGGGGGGYHTTGNMIVGGNGGSGVAIIRLPEEADYSASQLIEDLNPASNCTASYLNTQIYTDDPNFDDVSLLIRGDTLTDLSANTHTLTAYGNAAAGDASPVKYASGSLTFDGTGDYVTVPDAAVPDSTWGDFTIEFWFNSAASGYQMFFGTLPSNGDVTFTAIHGYKNFDNTCIFTVSDGTQELYFGSSAVSTGTWYHYAATRQGNTVRFFLDGVQQGSSQTFSGSLYDPTNPFRIGRSGNYTNNNAYNYNGNIEDFRITKGVARYTADFTPPTASLPNRETSTGGDHVITFTVATEDPYDGGATTNDGTITWTPFKDPSILDGSTANRAASSAAQILSNYPSLANQDGIYWINKNGTPTQIYCDMTTDGGGWMLYSSFASTNTLDATNYPAWNGNQILYSQISTYGYAAIGAGITNYHDGANNTFGNYTHYSGRLGVFYSSGPQGGIGATTWYGPSNVTELRINWGQGASNYSSGTNYIHINGSQAASLSGSSNTVGQYSFNPAGSSSPYFGVIENGIVGIGYVYMR